MGTYGKLVPSCKSGPPWCFGDCDWLVFCGLWLIRVSWTLIGQRSVGCGWLVFRGL